VTGESAPEAGGSPPRPARVVYPVLAGAFSVLYLWAGNLDQDIEPGEAVRLLLGCVVGTAIVFLVLRRLLRDPHRAGLATLVLVVLFFWYGYELQWMEGRLKRDVSTSLLAAFLLLAVVGVAVAIRSRRWAPRLTRGLNLVVAVLVLMNAVPIAVHQLTPTASASADAKSRPLRLPGVHLPDGPARDVYYVIFDRYANVKTLAEQYGFDDEPQMTWLEDHGFTVARDSLANYPKTTHSLSSSLNMEYLDDLAAEMGSESSDWQPLYDRFRGFDVERAFQGLGYRTEHVGSWWTPSAIDPYADENFVYGGQPEFSHVFLSTTMWPKLSEALGINPYVSFERLQYERVKYQVRSLEQIAQDPRPTFTFAHFTLPHPPYVFDAEGRFVPPDVAARMDQDRAYVDQLIYTNQLMRDLVDDLNEGPEDEDPIIVIQSDEGPHPLALEQDEDHYTFPDAPLADLQRKLRILNAYSLPGCSHEGLTPSITPVNSFRVVFDDCFGGTLPLLPERTYVYEDEDHPYRFTDVTDELRGP